MASNTPEIHPLAPDFSGRDRVLLYTRGMNISPSRGIALALRSMRRAGEYAPPCKVMEELFHILEESDTPITMTDTAGNPLAATPPLNRRVVLAEDMVQHSLTRALKNCVPAMIRRLRAKQGDPS